MYSVHAHRNLKKINKKINYLSTSRGSRICRLGMATFKARGTFPISHCKYEHRVSPMEKKFYIAVAHR